jgi:SNF2 family DNA or RNA helicase
MGYKIFKKKTSIVPVPVPREAVLKLLNPSSQLLLPKPKKKGYKSRLNQSTQPSFSHIATTAEFSLDSNSLKETTSLTSVTPLSANVIDYDIESNKWLLSFRALTKEEEKAGKPTAYSAFRYSLQHVLGARWIRNINGWSYPGTVYSFKAIQKQIEFTKQSRWEKEVSSLYLNDLTLTPLAEVQLKLKRDQEERWQNLREQTFSSDFVPYDSLVETLPYYPHQRNGAEFFLSHPCLIADDMGTGKTRVALFGMVQMHKVKRIRFSVVVCPIGVIGVWASQAKQYFPEEIFPVKVRGDFEERIRALSPVFVGSKLPLYIVGYATARDHPVEMARLTSEGLLLLDEAQNIKSPSSKTTIALSKLPCVERRALTGTPIVNTPKDGFTVFNFIHPGLLGNSYEQYLNYFAEKDGRFGIVYRNLKEFNERIQPFYIRRLKNDILSLPPKINIRDFESIPLGTEQRRIYREMTDKMLAELRDITDEEYQVSAMNRVSQIQRLLQICDGFLSQAVGEERWISDGGKLEVLKEIIEEQLANGNGDRKIVVWSRFLPPLKMLMTELAKYHPVVLYGDTPQERRGENSSSDITTVIGKFWKDPKCKILLGQMQTGGVGVDLSCADICIFYDQWWAPGINTQAEDRLHRVGQKNKVSIFTLVTSTPIEQYYFAWEYEDERGRPQIGMTHKKADWIETAVEGKGIPMPTREELIKLLQKTF